MATATLLGVRVLSSDVAFNELLEKTCGRSLATSAKIPLCDSKLHPRKKCGPGCRVDRRNECVRVVEAREWHLDASVASIRTVDEWLELIRQGSHAYKKPAPPPSFLAELLRTLKGGDLEKHPKILHDIRRSQAWSLGRRGLAVFDALGPLSTKLQEYTRCFMDEPLSDLHTAFSIILSQLTPLLLAGAKVVVWDELLPRGDVAEVLRARLLACRWEYHLYRPWTRGPIRILPGACDIEAPVWSSREGLRLLEGNSDTPDIATTKLKSLEQVEQATRWPVRMIEDDGVSSRDIPNTMKSLRACLDVTLEDTVGWGSFALIFRARETSGEQVAAKVFTRATAQQKRDGMATFQREVRALELVGKHDNIVPLIRQYYIPPADAFGVIIVPYAVYGNFLKKIATMPENTPKLEETLCWYYSQLIRAVWHCHTHRLAHHDVKPENCLLGVYGKDELCLADFGSAWHWPEEPPPPLFGTPFWRCPEQIPGPSADAFSCGCVLFALFERTVCFSQHAPEHGLLDPLAAEEACFVRDWWVHNEGFATRVPLGPADIIRRSLCMSQARITICDILDHEWLRAPSLPDAASAEKCIRDHDRTVTTAWRALAEDRHDVQGHARNLTAEMEAWNQDRKNYTGIAQSPEKPRKDKTVRTLCERGEISEQYPEWDRAESPALYKRRITALCRQHISEAPMHAQMLAKIQQGLFNKVDALVSSLKKRKLQS